MGKDITCILELEKSGKWTPIELRCAQLEADYDLVQTKNGVVPVCAPLMGFRDSVLFDFLSGRETYSVPMALPEVGCCLTYDDINANGGYFGGCVYMSDLEEYLQKARMRDEYDCDVRDSVEAFYESICAIRDVLEGFSGEVISSRRIRVLYFLDC